jgi:hypothetical protein
MFPSEPLARPAPAVAAALGAALLLLGACRRAPAGGAPPPEPAALGAGADRGVTSPPPSSGGGEQKGADGAAGGCRRTGCSGEICAAQERMTACDWRPEYACYGDARCERLPDGQCGWVSDDSLSSCLEEKARERDRDILR